MHHGGQRVAGVGERPRDKVLAGVRVQGSQGTEGSSGRCGVIRMEIKCEYGMEGFHYIMECICSLPFTHYPTLAFRSSLAVPVPPSTPPAVQRPPVRPDRPAVRRPSAPPPRPPPPTCRGRAPTTGLSRGSGGQPSQHRALR